MSKAVKQVTSVVQSRPAGSHSDLWVDEDQSHSHIIAVGRANDLISLRSTCQFRVVKRTITEEVVNE